MKKPNASQYRKAIEIMEIIRHEWQVRSSVRFEPTGPTSGVWIVKAMGKEFAKRDFVGAVAKMAEFVLNAHKHPKP